MSSRTWDSLSSAATSSRKTQAAADLKQDLQPHEIEQRYRRCGHDPHAGIPWKVAERLS
jgi:hypothetical protein